VSRQVFRTDRAPQPKGPYSPAVIHNGLLYVSGQGPVDPASGDIIRGTIEEEAQAVLDNIRAIIEAAGFSMAGVLKVTCYLADMDDFERFNRVYAGFFPVDPPARTTIQAGRLPLDIKVEIDAIVGQVEEQ
jgi:2-iminobutanoate/2-iminopropanoate deaminase